MACPTLPQEILNLVCAELWHQRDINTLFSCACTGKKLAPIAAMYLYRTQDLFPVLEYKSPRRNLRRCARLWRTIILSSLGKTLYPYSQYIRTLNLQDLKELLTREELANMLCRVLFQGELKIFASVVGREPHCYIDASETIDRMGEAITKQTLLLEVLIVEVLRESLSRWIPRLPRLTHLKSSPGKSIDGSGTLIRLHCPSFNSLDVHDWRGISDAGLAAFLNELHPQSLESLKINTCGNSGPKIFQALNRHRESLSQLTISGLSLRAAHSFSIPKGCTNLVSLSLVEFRMSYADSDSMYRDALLEVVAWLKECKKLRILDFTNLFDGPALLARVFSESDFNLISLKCEGPRSQDTHKFHQALANQTSLQQLCLIEQMGKDPLDSDNLVESLSKLVNLRELSLEQVSNSFHDQHVVQLARSLPRLESWSMSGIGFTDAIWEPFSSLTSLQRLELSTLPKATSDGILGFIEKLGSSNKGLFLVTKGGDGDITLSRREEKMINERIANKVGGKFECELWQAFEDELD